MTEKAAAAPEPVAWPSTASEISDFIGPHCNFRQHKFSDVEPHDDDVYEVSAHDLLSSFQQWREEHPSAAERVALLEGLLTTALARLALKGDDADDLRAALEGV
jgi:hypothetical protein